MLDQNVQLSKSLRALGAALRLLAMLTAIGGLFCVGLSILAVMGSGLGPAAVDAGLQVARGILLLVCAAQANHCAKNVRLILDRNETFSFDESWSTDRVLWIDMLVNGAIIALVLLVSAKF